MTHRILTTMFAVALAGAVAVGCATKQQTGAVAGAGAGGLAGAAVTEGHPAGVLLGALLGAAVGSEIGRQMDEYDRERAALILEQNQTYETAQWRNPDTGYAYRMTPVRTYEEPGYAGPCREFRMESLVGDRWQEVYGTACRQPDGSWRIVPE